MLGQTYAYGLYEFQFDEDIYYSTLRTVTDHLLTNSADNWPCACTDQMAACNKQKDQSGIDESGYVITDVSSNKDTWQNVQT